VSEVVEDLKLEITESTAGVSEAFNRVIARRGLSGGWRLIGIDDCRDALVGPARIADLIVAPAAEAHHDFGRAMVDLMLHSGAPCLVTPTRPATTRGTHHAPFGRVALAWNGSREAAKALREGMPLLEAASDVVVIVAAEEKTMWLDAANADSLVRHLALHSVQAELVRVPQSVEPVGEDLIAKCETFRADLLIMGAYGHSRTAETILGGATQTILRHPPCAVLMSH
jgi:nucleotide-binding universal stress UspA family protein